MARIMDNIIALRVAYLLITPIESTDAFKLGLIDKDGKTIKKASTSAEKDATSMLHRLCWNLKRMISLVPGGSTRIGSLIAAYALMKEAVEQEWGEDQLREQFFTQYNSLLESKELVEELNSILDQLYHIMEDAPVNSTSGIAGKDHPLTGKKLVRRKQYQQIEILDV